jgi:hypothetical protein
MREGPRGSDETSCKFGFTPGSELILRTFAPAGTTPPVGSGVAMRPATNRARRDSSAPATDSATPFSAEVVTAPPARTDAATAQTMTSWLERQGRKFPLARGENVIGRDPSHRPCHAATRG